MDRQVLGLLKPDLMRILNWTEKDYGIIAICFQAAYAFGQTAYGPLAQRFGMKATYAFSMVFWSLAAMAHALARTVFGLAMISRWMAALIASISEGLASNMNSELKASGEGSGGGSGVWAPRRRHATAANKAK